MIMGYGFAAMSPETSLLVIEKPLSSSLSLSHGLVWAIGKQPLLSFSFWSRTAPLICRSFLFLSHSWFGMGRGTIPLFLPSSIMT